MKSFTVTASLLSAFIISAVATGFIAISVMDQQKLDSELLGETISVRAGARMLADTLRQEHGLQAVKLFESIDQSIQISSDKIESTVFGMYPRVATELQTKVYSQNQKLKIKIEEISNNEVVIKKRAELVSNVRKSSDRLIKLSEAIAKRSINTSMTNGQLFYVSSQAGRFHKIKELVEGNGNLEQSSSLIKKELKNITNVLKQVEAGSNSSLKGKITNSNTRKVILAAKKKLVTYKKDIVSLVGTSNEYSQIKITLEEAAVVAENLSTLTNKLGVVVSTSNEDRMLKPSSVVFGILLTMFLLIGTAVTWWMYAKETAVIDSQRLKAQKIAYKQLLKDLKIIGEGDLTASINTANPHTKEIAGPLNEMIKSFGTLISGVVTQSEAASEGAGIAEEVRVDLINLSQRIEIEFKNHQDSLNDFQTRYNAFDKSYEKLPQQMEGQLIKLNKLMSVVSKNYELATKLTQEAREISNQFKNQSEVAQKLQSESSSIKDGLNKIESVVFDMQITASSENQSELDELLKHVQDISTRTTELNSNTDIIVTSSGENQKIIEEMRDLILSLNSVAEDATIMGDELKNESGSINQLLHKFKTSSDSVLDVVSTITTSTQNTKEAVTAQGEKLSVMLNSVSRVAKAVLKVKGNTEKFKVSKVVD